MKGSALPNVIQAARMQGIFIGDRLKIGCSIADGGR
jgi:hypothetical protein